MTLDEGFQVSLFGRSIAVLSECREALDYLNCFVAPWLPRTVPDPKNAEMLFRVAQAAEGGRFDAFQNERRIASNDTLTAIFGTMQCSIDERVVHGLRDLVAVHAGVVAWRGRVAVLPGSSQTGKTTLVRELLKKGAAYLSDEYALIDGEGRVHAYPRALMPRNGDGRQTPETAPSQSLVDGRAEPPGLVVSAAWGSGERWGVNRIPQSEALLLLLKNTPHEIAERPEIVDPLRRAVSLAECYAGVRGDAEEAAGRLLGLLQDLA